MTERNIYIIIFGYLLSFMGNGSSLSSQQRRQRRTFWGIFTDGKSVEHYTSEVHEAGTSLLFIAIILAIYINTFSAPINSL